MSKKKNKKPHHHGNLRAALIQAGTELLDEGGQAALTLRKCAARAGVSHAAPAHYFSGLGGLLTAIAARGFEIFTATMIAEAEAGGGNPRARLIAICNGYLRFARDHEAMFNLMFSSQELEFGDPELRQNSAAAYQVLRQGCAPFASPSGTETGTEIMVWSLVHGFAGISRKAQSKPSGHPARDIRFEDILPALELKMP
ncbi:Transcriptional regulator, AcrR family [hydrothermal vent metagenome]|uniref:Transcriptional regulator, AcrR family n=1 Tax=hydrothermal vent metagenome TaxID=652676 RepID=A0A3B0T7D5_9ZZZZ